MDNTFLTNLLLVGVIFAELLVYWSLPKTKVKRKYRHTKSYLLKNK